MRRHIIYVVLLPLLGIWARGQEVDVAAEKDAIKVAIQHEKDAYRTLDYEGYAASWVHAPYILHPGLGEEESIVGWNSLQAAIKNTIKTRRKEPDKNRVDELTASNFDIHHNGNIAYVIYDGQSKGIWGGEPFSSDGRQVTYLVKKDGEWKVLAIFNMDSETSPPE